MKIRKKKRLMLGMVLFLSIFLSQTRNVFALGIGTTASILDVQKELEKDINPHIILKAYDIESKDVVYGEETMIHLTFQNVSKTADVSNVVIVYDSVNFTVAPAYGASNTIYLDRINASSEVTYDLPITILSSTNGYIQMQFSVEYTANQTVYRSPGSYIVFKINAIGAEQKTELNSSEMYGWIGNVATTETSDLLETEEVITSVEEPESLNKRVIISVVGIIIILGIIGMMYGKKSKK